MSLVTTWTGRMTAHIVWDWAADCSRLVVLRQQRSSLQNCCAPDWQWVFECQQNAVVWHGHRRRAGSRRPGNPEHDNLESWMYYDIRICQLMQCLWCVGVSDWQTGGRDSHQLPRTAALQVSYTSEMSRGGKHCNLRSSLVYVAIFIYWCWYLETSVSQSL